MTYRDILAQTVSHSTGKSVAEASKIIDAFCLEKPEYAGKFDRKVPDEEAQKWLEDLRGEGPGIFQRLLMASDLVRDEQVRKRKNRIVH
jgi:hypothetical protein